MNPIFIKAKELFETEQHYLKLINLKMELNFEKIISLISKALTLVEDLNLCIVEQDPSNIIMFLRSVVSIIESNRTISL